MLLRHAEVREAAKDWTTFSSDAPFRVPIPSEESVRSVRQLPLETDPPQHGGYRALVEPLFLRAKEPDYIAKVDALVSSALDAVLGKEVEVVGQFAIPLQSRALTVLLNLPIEHADRWIGWGTHVFRKHDGLESSSGLDEYIDEQVERARQSPGEDFFSYLMGAELGGRPLTHAEILGYANIAFAGGRDTIIHTITSTLAYFAEDSQALDYLADDPKRVVLAVEELLRVFMPLTHIGRVLTRPVSLGGEESLPGARVALCWAAANRDEAVFKNPDQVRLDRKPNPHVSFGFGEHLCLGAQHARLLLRSVVRACATRLSRIECVRSVPRVEREATFERMVGYESLVLRFVERV